MPINKPKPSPSDAQIEKASRCVIAEYFPNEKWQVWDPKVDSYHWVTKEGCDCAGYTYHGYCSHIAAVALWEKRKESSKPVEEIIEELWL